MTTTKEIKNGYEAVLNNTDNEGINDNGIIELTTMIDDHKIGYCKYGAGKYVMLFICGGVGCYTKDFPEKLLNAFNHDNYTIICIDPPGYGKSRPPDRYTHLLIEILENKHLKYLFHSIPLLRSSMFKLNILLTFQQLNLTPFVVLGWSEGSRTAIHVAGQGKQLVKGAVLLAAATRIDQRGARIFRGMRNTNQWLPDAIEVYLKHYPKEFVEKQWADLCDVAQQVYELLGGRFPSDYVLPNLKIPVLVMIGGMDRFCVDPKYFETVIANCRTEKHSLGGHDFYLKYPRWFVDKVNEFITDPKNQFFC
uniref:AB hydrolase-1 domain-containing protein n=1 Tax=Elaeophora elaphi TaxID=1147741 RepID=A0A0R3RFV0_9BILA